MRMPLRRRHAWRSQLLGGVLALLAGFGAPARADPAPGSWSAERLYREGIGSDGQPLLGARPDGTSLQGSAAACINCHRRSGLGTAEGRSVIPPITGEFLFQPRATHLMQSDRGTTGVANSASGVTGARAAYDDSSLARALRQGLGSDGQSLSVLMPRYALGDHDMQALIAYLKTLGSGSVPGVGEETLHFATIITPDADPMAREGMLATLQQFFHDRNHIIAGTARPLAHNEHGVLYRVTRKWELHVWELSGAPDTWAAQLQQDFAAQPVFAVVSGLGGAVWEPVHRFCESRQLPCLFPNVDAPVANSDDFFSIYYSRGVFLEAELIAQGLADATLGPPVERVVEVVRAGSAGEAAADALAGKLAGRGVEVAVRRLGPGQGAAALTGLLAPEPGTALVLWLPEADIAALPATPPTSAGRVWISGLLGGLENMPLPEAWRARSEIAFPLELPERRALALKLPEGWFHIHHIELKRPREQYQTYVACQILSEMVGELHIALVPDYLVERAEVMLSHRRFNAVYPRLSLGVGQRFASKGGYLTHFSGPGTLAADGDWRVP